MQIFYIFLAIVGILVSGYIAYKFLIENRYDWVRFETGRDPEGVLCDILIYKDRYISGLQVMYFYDFKLNRNLATHQIKSMNTADKNNRILRKRP